MNGAHFAELVVQTKQCQEPVLFYHRVDAKTLADTVALLARLRGKPPFPVMESTTLRPGDMSVGNESGAALQSI